MKKLNIGCGHKKLEGYVNIDKYDSCKPDLVHDLEVVPWPFDESSVSEIVASHVLEHLGQTTDGFLAIMKELYRISAPDAIIRITVPHPRSESFAGDPTHVRPITPTILGLFSKQNNRAWIEAGYSNTTLGLYLDIDFEIDSITMNLTPAWADKLAKGLVTEADLQFASTTYNNVVEEILITLVARKEI